MSYFDMPLRHNMIVIENFSVIIKLSHKVIVFFVIVWYNVVVVMNMLINIAVKKEAVRNEQMISEYEKLISALPKGSLICRKNEYYYLKYRENGKVCDKYICKDMKLVEDIKEKLKLRKHYAEMLELLKEEKKTIHKVLEGLK